MVEENEVPVIAQEMSMQEVLDNINFLVLQNCTKCGIMVQYAPFGINTIDNWITIFQQYKDEGAMCKECSKENA